jgi:hypothetical protein
MHPTPQITLQESFNVVSIPFEEFLYMQKVAQGTMHAALIDRNASAQADIEQVFATAVDPMASIQQRAYATVSAFCLIDAHDSIALGMGKPSSVEEQAKRRNTVSVEQVPMPENKAGVCNHPLDVPCEKCGAG